MKYLNFYDLFTDNYGTNNNKRTIIYIVIEHFAFCG